MFTDLDDYSALAHKNEPLSLELLDEYRRLLRPLFSKHDGQEIKTLADGFLVEFASALRAVQCAVAIQKVLSIHNAGAATEQQIFARIGIHLGDIEHSAGDILGDGVNIASRIEPLAELGGVCITQQVYDQIFNKIETSLVSIGKPPLKNIGTPIEVYKLILPWESEKYPATAAPRRPSTEGKSIAVLPFTNLSPDPENEYFSDGLTDDIITQLSKISDLKVISRTSVMQYKKAAKSLPLIGQELGVATVLEGSVRRAGNRVRIAAQLVNAQNDTHLWAEAYDRELTDIFAIQSDVAQQIAAALQARVSPAEQQRIGRKPTENLEAHQLYLQGRFFWNKRTEEGIQRAITLFQQAIDRDPQYALAHAGLADAYLILADRSYGSIPKGEVLAQAKAFAIKAIELDGTLAEAHTSLAMIKQRHDHDAKGAEEDFKKALELNPNYATAHHWYGLLLMEQGRFKGAVRESLRAHELDPLSPILNLNAGDTFLAVGDFDKALALYQRSLELEPNNVEVELQIAVLFYHTRQYDRAIERLQKALERGSAVQKAKAELQLARSYYQKSMYDEALGALQRAERLSVDF
jgi:TolB-like protein/cytochrome c-type biogenesis protein CcmH/NrfG